MGNCIPVSSSVQGGEVALNFSDLMESFSYNYSDGYGSTADYAEAEPCHNYYCATFQRVAPAFLAATCVLAALSNGALLAALAARRRAWGGPPGRALAAQLAAAAALFALPLPFLAAGIARGWHLGPGLCKAAHGLRHWGLFAQGLLAAGGSCGAAWGGREPRRWRPAAALWAAALLLAAPAALSSGTVAAAPPACVLRAQGALAPAALALLALSLGLFLLLPLVAAAAARRRREASSRAPWLFFALWAPYGAGLARDAALRAGLLRPSCGAFEAFDTALGLAEALGVLHCGLVPLLLLAAALRPPPARPRHAAGAAAPKSAATPSASVCVGGNGQ